MQASDKPELHLKHHVPLRTIALAVALRLGHRSIPLLQRIRARIAAHAHADQNAGRANTRHPIIEPEQVALLLRAQSFRCLVCDCIMSVTHTVAEDAHAFSLGRIWNHLPHSFSNLCVICSCHNSGNTELRALKRLLNDEPGTEHFRHHLEKSDLQTETAPMRNLVVETLAPELLLSKEDHMSWIINWVEEHEGQPDAVLETAWQLLKEAGMGHTKREMLDSIADERAIRFKRTRFADRDENSV